MDNKFIPRATQGMITTPANMASQDAQARALSNRVNSVVGSASSEDITNFLMGAGRTREQQIADAQDLASSGMGSIGGPSKTTLSALEKLLPSGLSDAEHIAARAAMTPDQTEKYLGLLDKAYGPKESRAQALGFGSRDWYHGTTVPIDAFKDEAKGLSTGAQSAKKGFFFASDPSTASDYANLAHEKGVIREGDNVTTKLRSENYEEPERLSFTDYGDKKKIWNDLLTRKYQEEKRLKTLADWQKAKDDKAPWLAQSAAREGISVDDFIANRTQRIQNPIEPASKKEILSAKQDYFDSLKDFAATNPNASRFLNIDLEIAKGEEKQAILDAIKHGDDIQSSGGQQVGQYRLKGSPESIHVKNYKGEPYRDTTYSDEMAKAQEQGKNAVLFKNTYDPADPANRVRQDIAAVFNPNQIRSTNAAFDPRYSKSANILAGAAAIPVGLGTTEDKTNDSVPGFSKGGLVTKNNDPAGLDEWLSTGAGPASAPTGSAEPPGLDQFIAPEMEQQYGGAGGMLKAGLAGAARSASFGLSDQALVRAGVNPETLKGLQQTNPKSSFLGEAAGVVAPALLGDEAGVLGLLGKPVEAISGLGGAIERGAGKLLPEATSTAGKILKEATTKGLGLGAEGGAYGLGQSISEDALGDHDLVSEHTLSNIGRSAAFTGALGSVFGAGLGAFGKDASTIAEKIEAQNALKTTAPGSMEEVISQTGLPAEEKLGILDGLKEQKENTPEILAAAERQGLPVVPAQTSANEFVQKRASALSQSPTIPGEMIRRQLKQGFDKIKGIFRDVIGSEEGLSDFEAGAVAKDAIQSKVDEMYAPIKKAYSDLEAEGHKIMLPDEDRISLGENLEKQSQNYGSVGSDGGKIIAAYADRAIAQDTASQMDKLVSEIGGKQRIARQAGDYESAHALGQVQETLENFLDRQIAKQGKQLAKEGAPGTEDAINQLINERKAVRQKYADFKQTLNDLTSAGRISKKLNTYGTTESVLESVPNEKLIEKLFDKKNSAGLAKLKEKFPDLFDTIVSHKKSQIFTKSLKDGSPDIGKVLKEIKGYSPEIKKLLFTPEELQKLHDANTWIESLPVKLGPSGTPEGIEYMKHLSNPLGAVLANATDLGISGLLKFSSPQEAQKTMLLVNAEKQAAKGEKQIKKGISELFERSGDAIKPLIPYSAAKYVTSENFKDKAKEIASLANNAHQMHDTLTSATQSSYESAPKFTQSLQSKMVNSVNFLNSKLPVLPPGTPFMKDPEPSKAEIAKFNRYYSTVENPMSILKHIQDNTVSQESIETLETVFPKIFNQMKSHILEHVSGMKNPEEIPYKTKMTLSRFLGQPLHPSQAPQAIAQNQMTYNQAAQQSAQKEKGNETGESKLTLGKRMSLEPNDEA
jgi:hypothetical protein